VYATAAARLRRAEKVLIPVLDILQSLPVLGFLAGEHDIRLLSLAGLPAARPG
jgi:ABC-type anion transport system duplicated permease subunit